MLKLKLLARLWQCERGNALVEFVFVAPMLLLVLFGGSEFGRLFIQYHKIDKGVRAATRYLSRVPCEGLTARLDTDRNIALRGTVGSTGSLVVPAWNDPITVTLLTTVSNCTTAPPSTVQLRATVTLPFRYLPFLGLGNTLTVQAEHEERHVGL
jgi:Flp pilus assembly protein TadG